jgi:hypothetical protein
LFPGGVNRQVRINSRRATQAVAFNAARLGIVLVATPTPTPTPTGATINLSQSPDTYSDIVGGITLGGSFVPNSGRLTSFSDTINARTAGDLGFLDDLRDPSSTDRDVLNISTNNVNTLEFTLLNVQRIVGIENLSVTMAEDISRNLDFVGVEGAKSLSLSGSWNPGAFTYLDLYNIVAAGIRDLDASALRNLNANPLGLDVRLGGAQNETSDSFRAILTIYDDYFVTSFGAYNLRTLDGDDSVDSYSQGPGSVFELGKGVDIADLSDTAAASETVKMIGITDAADGDTIFDFAGSTNPGVFAPDKIEFDALTYTNYRRGRQVSFVDAANAELSVQAGRGDGIVIYDTFNNIQNANVSNGKSWLGYAFDTEEFYFSSNGDFASRRELIADMSFISGELGVANIGII